MLGNTFGDLVKGKKMVGVHPQVRQGVLLHRRIDDFTDKHQLVKKCVEVFKPALGRFSPAVVDMVFDYFLAHTWSDFSQVSLPDFVAKLFLSYDQNRSFLTDRINAVAPIMKMQEWMLQYETVSGLENILKQMSARIKYRAKLEQAIPILIQKEKELALLFSVFFQELRQQFQPGLAAG